MKLLDNDSEEEKVLAVKETGKCILRTGDEVGDELLDKQVAQKIADSESTCHMTPDANGLLPTTENEAGH